MKFLIDAQLPRRMVGWFAAAGCDANHTLDLRLRNRTPDKNLVTLADQQQRVLVTKDGGPISSTPIYFPTNPQSCCWSLRVTSAIRCWNS
jgi:predicted nuclease of predicted toxin-antitoxin system